MNRAANCNEETGKECQDYAHAAKPVDLKLCKLRDRQEKHLEIKEAGTG